MAVSRWIKHPVRAFACVALLFALAVVCLYFSSFSFAFIHTRVRDSFRQATGLDLQFGGLAFYPAQGFFDVEQPRVIDPESNHTLLEARSLRIDVDWSPFRWKDFSHIEAVDLDSPSEFIIVRTDRKFTVSDDLQNLADSLSQKYAGDKPSYAAVAKSSKSPGMDVDAVRIDNVNLNIVNASTGKPDITLSGARISGMWKTQTDFDLSIIGDLNPQQGEPENAISLRVSAQEGERVRLRGRLNSLDTREQLAFLDLPVFFSGEALSLDATIVPPAGDDGPIAFDGTVSANRFNSAVPDGQPLTIDSAAIALAGEFRPAENALSLTKLTIASPDLNLDAEAALQIGKPFAYVATVNQLDASKRLVEQAQNLVPAEQRIVTLSNGSLSAEGELGGELGGNWIRDIEANLRMRGMDIDGEELAMPLRGLDGSMHFDGRRLSGESIEGQFGQTRMRLGGVIESGEKGRLLDGHVRTVDLHWSLDGRLEDLAAFAIEASPENAKDFQAAGGIWSVGTVFADLGATGTLRTAAKNALTSGTIALKGARFEHAQLPAPLEGVDGAFAIQNTRLVAESLNGTMLNSKVGIEGSIEGSPYFWKNPQADFRLKTDLDLALLGPQIEKQLGEKDFIPEVKGRARADIAFRGNPLKPETMKFEGKLAFNDVAASLKFKAAQGPITNASGEFIFDGRKIEASALKFSIGAVNYEGRGIALPDSVEADVRIAGPLEAIRQNHPYFDEKSDPRGDIEATLKFAVTRIAGTERTDRSGDKVAFPALDLIRDAAPTEAFLKKATLAYEGSAQLRGAAITLDTGGIAGRIENARGAVAFKPDRIDFQEVAFNIGDIQYGLKGEFTADQFKADLRLDGPFPQLKVAHRELLKYYDVAGSIQSRFAIDLIIPREFRAPRDGVNSLAPVMPFLQGADNLNKTSFDGLQTLSRMMAGIDGEVINKDVEFTYVNLPKPFHHMNGPVLVNLEGIDFNKIKGMAGDDPVTVTGFYRWGDRHPNDPPGVEPPIRGLDVTLSSPKMNMDAWYGPWKVGPPEFAYVPPKTGVRPFLKSKNIIVVDVKEALFKSFVVQNHRGEFHFYNWKGPMNYVDVVEVSGKLYDGEAKGTGVLRFPRDFPYTWAFKVEAKEIDVNKFTAALFQKEGAAFGRLTLNALVDGSAGYPEMIKGQGKATIRGPRLPGLQVVTKLEEALKIDALTKSVFPKLEGDFILQDGKVYTENLGMGNEIIELRAAGNVAFKGDLNLDVYAKPLGGIDKIPILNQIGRAVSAISSSLLKFSVSGTSQNPTVKPVPLSVDFIADSLFGSGDDKEQPKRRIPDPTPPPLRQD